MGSRPDLQPRVHRWSVGLINGPGFILLLRDALDRKRRFFLERPRDRDTRRALRRYALFLPEHPLRSPITQEDDPVHQPDPPRMDTFRDFMNVKVEGQHYGDEKRRKENERAADTAQELGENRRAVVPHNTA